MGVSAGRNGDGTEEWTFYPDIQFGLYRTQHVFLNSREGLHSEALGHSSIQLCKESGRSTPGMFWSFLRRMRKTVTKVTPGWKYPFLNF